MLFSLLVPKVPPGLRFSSLIHFSSRSRLIAEVIMLTHDPPPGMLTRAELCEAIERGEIETVLTVFPDMYGRLMGKRITGHFFIDHVADGGMHACDYLLACDMEMDVIPGYKYTSWETGYGDFHCVPDFATLRQAAWLPRTAMILCDLFSQHGEVVEVAPRRMLQ